MKGFSFKWEFHLKKRKISIIIEFASKTKEDNIQNGITNFKWPYGFEADKLL